MFLLKYTGNNAEGYKLVCAATEEEAIEKLKKELWFIDNIHITNETLT